MYMSFKQWLWRTLIESAHIESTKVKFAELTKDWLMHNLQFSEEIYVEYKTRYMVDCTKYGGDTAPTF